MADVFDTLTPDKPQAAAGDVFDQVSPQPGTSVNKSTPGDVFDTVEYQEDKADPFRAAGQATYLSAGPNIHAWDALKSGEFMEFYNRAKNWLSAAGEDVANGTNQTALGSLLKSMGSHGTFEAQRFSQDMRDEVLGTTPKTPTQRVMRSIGKTAAGAVLSPLDWVPDVLQGTSRAAKAVPGALEATGAAIEGDKSKAGHSTVGAFNDLVGGGFQALTPIISAMYPASLAEGGIATIGPELYKTGTTLASAMGMQFAGQVLAADMGADPDVQEAVGNVFGLATFKAFHTLFGPSDFEKFGHQFNDYTNAEAAYRSSAQELSVQREQVRATQAAVDEAAAAERGGTGSRAQTIAARQAASEASASALKAQKKFEIASDARAKAKVEIDKTTNRIERAMEKERQKAKGRNSEVAQVATDSWNKFSRAIRSSGTRQFDQNDYEVWRNYAEPHHENVDPIMSIKDVAESAEVEREQLENDARSKVHGEDYKDQPLQTDIEAGNQALDHVRRSLAERDNVQPGFADRAISYLQEKFNTTDLTLSEADKLRAEINRLNRAKLKESGWNVSDAMASDSNFAAREVLNDYLKETIEQRLQDLGVDGVRENRMDQASLVRIRNAAEGMLSSNSRAGEVMVRGTGENSRGRRAVSWLVKRFAQGGGAALGAELGGPGGAAFGAATGGMLSEPILEKILRPNLTRDQLIQSIMQDKNGNPIKVATGLPARITAGATPGAPPAAPMPPIPPEPAPYEARDKDLHGDMMTYFDKRPGQDGSSYPELVQMVKDEMDIYQKHGVKAADRPSTLNDLANRITKEELAEDLERAKEARDRAAKKAEKAATVESVAQEATGKAADEVTPADKAKLSTEQAAAAAAIPAWDWKQLFPFKYSDTELEVPQELWGDKSFDPFYTRIHELAHTIANLKIGAPPIDVLSHIGTKGESWAAARADVSRFENEDGSTNMDAVRANMGDLLTRFAIGGVAEQIHGGARFDENSTLSTDLANAKEMLNALDIPEERQHELMRSAIQQAHEWLTEPGVKELMETYARKRIADTPDTHHFTKEHIKAFSNALGELVGGDYEPNDTDDGKKTSGKGLERVQSEVGEGREGAASGREGQAAQDLDVRKSVPETKGGKAEKGLVERTTGSEAEDRAIKAGGGIPAGTVDMGGKIRMFHDPETGTTLGIREGEELTPETVRKQIEESRAKYAAGEARQKLGTEKATPAESLSDRLVETYGTTDDPHSAAFILNDGRMVPLHNTHNDMLDTLYRKYGDIGVNEAERTAFINDEGAVRTRLRTGRGGSEVVFSVPKDGVKPEQVEQIKKSVGKLRNGNVVMEIADENGRGASAKKEFARVSDVEPMLREIGAAPKIGLETEQAITPKEADENYKKYLEAQKTAEEKEAENKKSFKLETGISKAAPETAPHVVEGANSYNEKHGRPEINPETLPHDPEFAKRVADAYDAMQHNPNDPAVKKSYDAMEKEVRQQWDHAVNDMGMKFEPWTKEGQPYANSKEMVRDVRDNKHLFFFQGGDIKADSPMAKVDPETGLTYNDMFRAVHDLFGHAAHGNEFGPKGEEKAYQLHRQMFSPEAVPALTSETRGQNSWVNYGKHLRNEAGNVSAKGEPGFVPQAERPYAEQKVGLLPAEFHNTESYPTRRRGGAGRVVPDWNKLNPEQVRQAIADHAYAHFSLDEIKNGDPWLSEIDKKEGKVPELRAEHGSDAGFLHPDGSMSMIGDSFLHDVFEKEIGLNNPDLVKKAGIGTYDIWSAPHGNHTGIAFDLAAPPTSEQIQSIAALTKHMREGDAENFQSVHVTWPGGEKGIEFPTPGNVVRELKSVQGKDWAEKVVGNLAKESAGGINPNNPEAPSARYGLEVLPEARQPHEGDLTADHFRNYADRPEVKGALAQHPNVKLGWDTGGEKPELNVGASTDDKQAALDVAKKLDQRALWDNEKKEEIPVGGAGKKTSFPEYPLEYRLRDLNLSTEKAAPYPTRKWIEQQLRENIPASYRGAILDSFIVGSEAKGTAGPKSDLDVAVVVPQRNYETALQKTESWHSRQRQEAPIKWNGRKVDIQFFYPDDPELKSYSKIPMKYEEGSGDKPKPIDLDTEKAAPQQHPDIVSTAVPTGKNAIADPHAEHVRIDMNSIPEKPMAKIAARVREVPGIKVPENIKDPTKVVNRYIDQAKDNLKYLYNKVPAETRNQNAKWYESANNIADRISNEHGKSVRQGAGVIASLSPQKDWNMNVGLAERLMNVYHEQTGESLTPEAKDKAREIGLGGMAARIGDRKLSELTDPLEKAAFIRIWDEAHNDRSFRDVDPATGNYRDVVKTDAGEPYKIAWGSLNEIAKSIKILEDGSRENISRTLGMGHKVRNFYNNIIDPNNPGGHVTVDTHAVAAAQMRPLSSVDPEVLFHFGRLSAAQTGLKGMYPVHAEAYRQAATELGIQPRQLQSVVWEEARRLFSADLKSDPEAREAIDNVWRDYEKGKLSLNEARDAVYNTAKQFNDKIARDKAEGKRQTSFGFESLAQPSKFANISGTSGPVMEGAAGALSGKQLNLKTEQSAPSIPPQTLWDAFGPKTAPGLVTRGNINLSHRPVIKNADGSHSSEYSTSMQDEDGKEVLVPTVVNGRFLTPDGKKPMQGSAAEKAMFRAAWDYYKKTGQHMGKFDTPEHADAYAVAVHNRKQ